MLIFDSVPSIIVTRTFSSRSRSASFRARSLAIVGVITIECQHVERAKLDLALKSEMPSRQRVTASPSIANYLHRFRSAASAPRKRLVQSALRG